MKIYGEKCLSGNLFETFAGVKFLRLFLSRFDISLFFREIKFRNFDFEIQKDLFRAKFCDFSIGCKAQVLTYFYFRLFGLG